jgi:hypothetical protein
VALPVVAVRVYDWAGRSGIVNEVVKVPLRAVNGDGRLTVDPLNSRLTYADLTNPPPHTVTLVPATPPPGRTVSVGTWLE